MTSQLLTDAAGKSIAVVDVGVDGYLMPFLAMDDAARVKALFDHIPDFKCRADDVMLLTYMKTGTTWVYEILMMLLARSSERLTTNKMQAMLEFSTQEQIDMLPSPRVLNTQVQYRFLPRDLSERQLRTVIVLRNPKDAMVSYFNHMRGLRYYGYDGTWGDWFQMVMKGKMEYGMYVDYLKQLETAMNGCMGVPFHLVYYENLLLNGMEEIKKLAEFLGVDEDEELFSRIMAKCSFETMRQEQIYPPDFRQKMFMPEFNFFRKGKVGDWKNWFTVAQNEQFDAYWDREMGDSKLKFIYEPKLIQTRRRIRTSLN